MAELFGDSLVEVPMALILSFVVQDVFVVENVTIFKTKISTCPLLERHVSCDIGQSQASEV